ncbi:MAG: hypothetical protein DIU71_07130 [Proteobacteria bacterium]|nr:MAG: hypothetical protein DIU71_07130 [Pseudomonadota bacterium]
MDVYTRIEPFLLWLEETRIAAAVRESPLLFPWVESLHVLAIALLVGTIAVVDLRLLGVASRERPVTRLLAEILPFTWVAFIGAAITGALMFVSQALHYATNVPFLWKSALLGLALINLLVFHRVTARTIERWDTGPALPVAARLAGGASLAIWIGVVAFGRWIGFT